MILPQYFIFKVRWYRSKLVASPSQQASYQNGDLNLHFIDFNLDSTHIISGINLPPSPREFQLLDGTNVNNQN